MSTVPVRSGLSAYAHFAIAAAAVTASAGAGLSLSAVQASAAERVGTAVQVTSPVRGILNGRRRNLTASAPVFFKERLNAGSRGLGQFILNDNTKLALTSGASLTLDNVVVRRRGRRRVWLRLAKGAMRFATGNSRRRAYKINAASATLGVRGTLFDVYVRRGTTFVLLLEGRVRVCGRGRCRNLVRKCDWVEVNRGGRLKGSRGVRNVRPAGSGLGWALPFLDDARLIPGLVGFGDVCRNFSGQIQGGLPLTPWDRPDSGSNPNGDRPTRSPTPSSDGEEEEETSDP